jgi:hypothetical protein
MLCRVRVIRNKTIRFREPRSAYRIFHFRDFIASQNFPAQREFPYHIPTLDSVRRAHVPSRRKENTLLLCCRVDDNMDGTGTMVSSSVLLISARA